MLDQLIFYFLLLLGFGSLFSYGLLNPRQVGPRFFQYHGGGFLITMLAAFYFKPADFSGPMQWGILAAISGLALSSGLLKTITAASLSGSIALYSGLRYLDAGSLTVSVRGPVPPVAAFSISPGVVAINLLLVALMLGFAMTAMWLGHWYLTQPKLSIDELKRITLWLMAILAVRILAAAYFTLPLLPSGEAELYRFFASSSGIFIVMRVSWGLLMPVALLWMVWKTVQIRSTQSATGILYVLLLSVLAGETLSLYLMFHDAWIL